MHMHKSNNKQVKLGFVCMTAAIFALFLFSLPRSAAAQSVTPSCAGQAATIVFVGYDSAIFGTTGDDVIVVQGGWNHIHASSGSDIICVSGHFNMLRGEAGDDTIIVDGIHNTLSGDAGDDVLEADDGYNSLRGGEGINLCNGASC